MLPFRFPIAPDSQQNGTDTYNVRMGGDIPLNTGEMVTKVHFRTVVPCRGCSLIKPPNPELLRVHAAFVHVLEVSSISGHLKRQEMEMENAWALKEDGKTDVDLLMRSRLVVKGLQSRLDKKWRQG